MTSGPGRQQDDRPAGHGGVRRRLLAPEVVQTSAMDCGPAVLASLLGGFGTAVDHGRLREACQTEVDGTSIDQVEGIARRLGLDAEQVMIPVDHVPRPESGALPAVLVTRRPEGAAHFVLVWRRWGPWLEVMDPSVGRRLVRWRRLRDEVLVHRHRVACDGWRSWAGSEDFLAPLRGRLDDLRVPGAVAADLCARACDDPSWRSLAALDAVLRMVSSLVGQGVLRAGREAERALRGGLRRARLDPTVVPERFWSVGPAPPGAGDRDELELRGAVLVRVAGRRVADNDPARQLDGRADASIAAVLGPGVPGVVRETLGRLRAAGPAALATLTAATALAAAGRVAEALVLRGLLNGDSLLGHGLARLGALAAAVVLVALLTALELQLSRGLLRLGRHLEGRLRLSVMEQLPRIRERFFRSRVTSDVAERCHGLHLVRGLPPLVGDLLRSALQLAFTVAGIVWLAPESSALALAAAGWSLLLPAAAAPLLIERERTVRVHVAALVQFFHDATAGSTAIQVHGGGPTLSRLHGRRLRSWTRARLELQRTAVALDGLVLGVGFGLAAWLLLRELGGNHDWGAGLLLAYWALAVPLLGLRVGSLARRLPIQRALLGRVDELLHAAAEPAPAQAGPPPSVALRASPPPSGVAVELEAARVRAGGHTLLADVELRVAAGEHLAVLGHSGAGKTTLLGVLLGWHELTEGRLRIGGRALDRTGLDDLRRLTAWVDPDVHLFNRSLLENICYGSPSATAGDLASVIVTAGLEGVLQHLPEGLQTLMGEGGAGLSAGECQRVRLARALARPNVRLALLDEPFRGLDRRGRTELLAAVRRWWRYATLLYVTHSPSEALAFERAVVLHEGRVAEDGCPSELAARPGSRLRRLLDAEHGLLETRSSAAGWRWLALVSGRLQADQPSRWSR